MNKGKIKKKIKLSTSCQQIFKKGFLKNINMQITNKSISTDTKLCLAAEVSSL